MHKAILYVGAVALLMSTSVVAAPAPPISYVEIRYVGSSNQGWEPISENQYSTTLDHGGAQLRVLTVEIGYGSTPGAKVDGINLPASANYQSDPFCNYSNFLQPCSPGQIVVGWVRYWNLDSYQSGTFGYQNTSKNSPWNTLGDILYIL